jgi:hypothetical protein
MQHANQFSLVRLLSVVTLLSVACWFLSDFILGTWRSLIDGPALLACVAAALACLAGNVRQVCFVGLLVFALVPAGVAILMLFIFLIVSEL